MNCNRWGECSDRYCSVELIDRLTVRRQGQALETLYVIDGVIVYSGLVQRLFWEQRSLVAQSFIEGSTLMLSEENGLCLRYKIVDVMRLARAPRYRVWLEQVDAHALRHWGEHDYTRRSGANMPGDSWIESYLDGLSPSDAWEIEMRAASTEQDALTSVSSNAQYPYFAEQFDEIRSRDSYPS